MSGTHSKWARDKDGQVTRFSTAMTGEVFGLLARQSTLSHFIQVEHGSFDDSASFEAGVPLNSTNPFTSIKIAAEIAADRGPSLIGAGTVLSAQDVEMVHAEAAI